MVTIKFPETDYIGCRFPQCTGRNGNLVVDNTSKEYIYKLLPGMYRPTVGNMCVVSCSNGYQVAVVTSINQCIPDGWKEQSMANVVGFVDFEAYRTMMENKKRKEALKEQLLRKKKELDERLAWDIYAEKSPEFAELLKQYNSL